jgi:pilus assembly protein CpaC
VPVAQGTGGNVAISVSWKEFGIRLNFTPVVIGKPRAFEGPSRGQHARLQQRGCAPGIPDSSVEHSPHGNRARVGKRPDVRDRRPDEQHHDVVAAEDSGHRRHPILGLLFKSKAAQKEQTELVVMITPEILASGSSGVTSNLPRQVEPYMPPVKKTFDPPSPAFQTPSAAPRGAARKSRRRRWRCRPPPLRFRPGRGPDSDPGAGSGHAPGRDADAGCEGAGG